MELAFENIDTGDVNLHFAVAGDRSKPVIICLHGFPEYWAAWRQMVPLLADRFCVVAPDQRGFGGSDKPADPDAYEARRLVADIAALADRMSPDQPFLLFGHDWGAAVAYAYAFRHPQRLRGLVIANGVHPVPFQRAILDDPEQRAASQYMRKLRSPEAHVFMRADNYARTLNMMSGYSVTDWMSDADREDYIASWSGEGTMEAMLNWYRTSPIIVPPTEQSVSDIEGPIPVLDAPEDALQVNVPHLLLWGERDEALRPVCIEGLDRFARDLEIVRVADAGHWILHEQPNEVTSNLFRWMDAKSL